MLRATRIAVRFVSALVVDSESNVREPYLCKAICRILIALEPIARAIGTAGDRLYLPLRITGGSITGLGHERKILSGDDFAVMYADEKLVHNGRFVAADPVGDMMVWYAGTTEANEGAYDDLIDGQLPRVASCRMNVVFVSAALRWRPLTVLSVTETDSQI